MSDFFDRLFNTLVEGKRLEFGAPERIGTCLFCRAPIFSTDKAKPGQCAPCTRDDYLDYAGVER